MSVLKALIAVMIMQLASTLKGVTSALVTLDTQAMGFLAQVSVTIQTIYSTAIYLDVNLMLAYITAHDYWDFSCKCERK